MEESGSLALLKDNKKQADRTIFKIKTALPKLKSAERSDRKAIEQRITMDIRTVKGIIETMDMEVNRLQSEQYEREYRDIISVFKSDLKSLSEELRVIKSSGGIQMEDIEVNEKRVEDMNAQEAMDKIDEILNEDDQAIDRMLRRLKETKTVANDIKTNLNKQREQLEATQKNLKEMDYSLDRAAKTLKTMLRGYATDKLILILIVIIVLVIIGIIIAAAVGGDPEGNFNVPHDIFKSKESNVTTGAL